MDSTVLQILESTAALTPADTEPNWVTVTIVSAIVAGIVSIFTWLLQIRVAKKQQKQLEREQLARVWGLALFELREAILRSISFLERFEKGEVSLGVLYLSPNVASDYFKSYLDLSSAGDMHWVYAMLSQIQVNLTTSRHHAEAGPGGPTIYVGAAAGFVKDHRNGLVERFNICLQRWTDYCEEDQIAVNLVIDPILG